MLTRQQILDCYTYVLGRPPEGEEIIEYYIKNGHTLEQLRQDFIHSDEFVFNYGNSVGQAPSGQYLPDILAPNHIEWQLPANLANPFFADVQRAWEGFGEDESFWSVLTDESYKSGSLAENKLRFYATGELEVNRLWNMLERNFIDFERVNSALEYGCGVGRVTHCLAKRISKIYGVDISNSHLKVARNELKAMGTTNVDFIHAPTLEILGGLPKVDLFFTTIVLQHNPPPVIAKAVECLLDCLVSGGYGYFQVPTYRLNYHFAAQSWLDAGAAGVRNMEMHSVPQRVLFELFERAGCRVLEVAEDNSTGIRNVFRSNVFLVEKR